MLNKIVSLRLLVLLIAGENLNSMHFKYKEASLKMFCTSNKHDHCPVDWDCRIHRLHLCRGVTPPPPNEYPGYDTKRSDGEAPVMLGLWGMWSTPSLPLLPGSL